MNLGITATRSLDDTGRRNITHALTTCWEAGEVEVVVVGGAIGGDAWAGKEAARLGFNVHVILPEDDKEIDPDWEAYATSAAVGGPYRARNQAIVDMCHALYAFPDYPEEHGRSKRSGTWMTVRMARNAGKPVAIWPQHLDPDHPSTRVGTSRRSGGRRSTPGKVKLP